ncbi:GDP-mannose 4,6-dehydratase [Methanospirillum sp.]
MKVAVIGSNSFSGSDFIDYLLEKPDVEIIGTSRSPEKSEIFLPYKSKQSSRFHFFQYDLNHDTEKILTLFDNFKPEYIVNFAAQSEVGPSWIHPDHWFETNVVSLARLVNGLKDKPYLRRYVHISSPEVYGTCEGVVTESAPLNPSTPYSASKAAADLLLSTYVKNFNFPLITIRSTNVYGAHQQLFKIIPKSVILIKKGEKIPLHGGGIAVKSYIHIRDISKGEYLAMTKGVVGEIYHLSPDHGYAVRDIVNMICNLMGVSFNDCVELVEERLGQDKAYVIDSSKIRNYTQWDPYISIETGLKGVIDWINRNWEVIKKMPIEYAHLE